IDPAKKGTFTAQATKMGLSVQEAAKKILSAPEGKYSSAMRRKANFARNFAKQNGGNIPDNSSFGQGTPLTLNPGLNITFQEQFQNYQQPKSVDSQNNNLQGLSDF